MGALFIAAAVAVTVGAVLQSARGFGFALVAAPLLFPTLGRQEAIGTLLVLACVGSLLILAAERRKRRRHWPATPRRSSSRRCPERSEASWR